MNIIRNFGITLAGHIENNNKVSSDKVMKLLNEYVKHRQDTNDFINMQKNIYTSLYENARTQNDMVYNTYLVERAEAYEAWQKNGNKASLIELLQVPKPDIKNVPEIYTYTIINPHKKAEEPKQPTPPSKTTQKPIKKTVEAVKKTKECPEGKIYNEKTGRCIADPNLKKVAKEPKAAKEPKECPEGKIYNEKTGRCIADPNLKKNPKKATK